MTPAHARRVSDHCPSDPSRRCELADAAAETAVRKMFAIVGVDVDEPADVEEFRKSLRFGDDMRRAYSRGVLVVVGLAAAAVWGVVASGLKIHVGGG